MPISVYWLHTHQPQDFLCQYVSPLRFTEIIMVCQLPPCWSSRATFPSSISQPLQSSQAAETKQRVKIHYTINIKSSETSSDKRSCNLQPWMHIYTYTRSLTSLLFAVQQWRLESMTCQYLMYWLHTHSPASQTEIVMSSFASCSSPILLR